MTVADRWELTIGARLHVICLPIFNAWVGLAYILAPDRYRSAMFLQARHFFSMQVYGAVHIVIGLAILVLYLLGYRQALFWALFASSAYCFVWMGLSLQTAQTNNGEGLHHLVGSWSGGALYWYPAVSAVGLAFVMLPSRRTRKAVQRAEAILRTTP